MRRLPLPSIALLASLSLSPSAAMAKGSALRFSEERYAPGDVALAHAEVETWRGSGQPKDGPYPVYLVRGRHPLHFGHLPRSAIRVGDLEIGALVESRLTAYTYRVRVAFEVPRLPNGPYAVWVCTARSGGSGCWLGFGDLVYGRLVVAPGTLAGSRSLHGPAVSAAAVPAGGDEPVVSSSVIRDPASTSASSLVGIGLLCSVAAIVATLFVASTRRPVSGARRRS